MADSGNIGGVLGGAAVPDPDAGAAAVPFPPESTHEMGSAPGRVIRNEDRRVLTDGRVFRFQSLETTGLVGSTYFTEVVGERPSLDCGCAPQSLDDLFPCADQDCEAVVCSRHAWTCSSDGATYCSADSVAVETEEGVAVVCRRCARAMQKKGIFSLLKSIFGGWL